MSTQTPTLDAPKKPRARARQDWHPADVKAALEKRGLSMSQLSRGAGYSPGTLSAALRRPYPHCEAIIAEALGMRPQEIWPTRYDAAGEPLRSPRGPRFRTWDSIGRTCRTQQLKREEE